MRRLAGKVAVVTGASRGIGAACALALAREGARVIVSDVLDENVTQVVAAIRNEGGIADPAHLDVSDAPGWMQLVEAVVASHGRIDCLVNNAGIDIAATIEDASIEDFERILRINLFGAFHGMQAVIPAMKRSGGGSIINIASLATRMTAPTTAIYGASKAALANLTKSAAIHCARQGYGIRVNSIHPGPIETAMLFGEGQARAEDADLKPVIGMIPLGRLGQPADVAGIAVFLASDESAYVTAEEYFIDGGLAAV